MRFRYDLVWKKSLSTGFLNANKMPLRNHENIYVFYKKLPVYNPQYTIGKPYCSKNRNKECGGVYRKINRTDTVSDGKRYPASIIEVKNDRVLKACEKPVPLMQWLILTYTVKGDTVLDNCMGLGSTGEACIKTGRRFIGIELDKERFNIARERITAVLAAEKNKNA